jgi:hypothetical protein
VPPKKSIALSKATSLSLVRYDVRRAERHLHAGGNSILLTPACADPRGMERYQRVVGTG